MVEDDTLYGILGVGENDDGITIKTAYRNLVKKWHPDVCDDSGASERFKLIDGAYKILINSEQRQIYDDLLRWEQRTVYSPGSRYVNSRRPGGSTGRYQPAGTYRPGAAYRPRPRARRNRAKSRSVQFIGVILAVVIGVAVAVVIHSGRPDADNTAAGSGISYGNKAGYLPYYTPPKPAPSNQPELDRSASSVVPFVIGPNPAPYQQPELNKTSPQPSEGGDLFAESQRRLENERQRRRDRDTRLDCLRYSYARRPNPDSYPLGFNPYSTYVPSTPTPYTPPVPPSPYRP